MNKYKFPFKVFVKITDAIEQKRYRKYISNFYAPIETKNMSENIEGLTEFDLIENVALGGGSTKCFAMLDSSYFSQYFDEVKKGKSTFESYLENDDIKTDQIPSKISTLLKINDEFFYDAEVFASYVLNFLNVKLVIIPLLMVKKVLNI